MRISKKIATAAAALALAAGLPDEIARYAKEQGAAPDAPQIILKRNAPNEKEDKQ